MRSENAYSSGTSPASCPLLTLLFPRATAGAPSIALSLPPELWLAILSRLSPPEAWRTRLVCKLLRDLVEEHLSVPWLADCLVTPFRWCLDAPPRFLQKGIGRWRDWSGYFGRKKISKRDEQYLVVPLPATAKRLRDRLRSAKRRSQLWYDVLGSERRGAMLEIERIPLWIRLLESDSLTLAVKFNDLHERGIRADPCFTLYSASARKVRTGRARAGFQLRYDGGVPALLIDWRVFLSTMLNDPWQTQFRIWQYTEAGGIYMASV